MRALVTLTMPDLAHALGRLVDDIAGASERPGGLAPGEEHASAAAPAWPFTATADIRRGRRARDGASIPDRAKGSGR